MEICSENYKSFNRRWIGMAKMKSSVCFRSSSHALWKPTHRSLLQTSNIGLLWHHSFLVIDELTWTHRWFIADTSTDEKYENACHGELPLNRWHARWKYVNRYHSANSTKRFIWEFDDSIYFRPKFAFPVSVQSMLDFYIRDELQATRISLCLHNEYQYWLLWHSKQVKSCSNDNFFCNLFWFL